MNKIEFKNGISIDVIINKDGIVQSYESEFNEISKEDVQRIITKLMEKEYIYPIDEDITIQISEWEDKNCEGIDIYHRSIPIEKYDEMFFNDGKYTPVLDPKEFYELINE